jgi:tetratricopeptide (TPR) repeat protein
MSHLRPTQARALFGASAISLVALVAPRDAAALSCDEIIQMSQHGVPEGVLVTTVKESGDVYSQDDVRCLEQKGAPAAVVAQARRMMAAEETPAAAAPPVKAAPSRTSALEGEDDLLGARAAQGSKSLSDGEEGEASDGSEPAKLKEAVQQYRAKKPLAASLMLFELLEEGKYPEHAPKIHYYLARSLEMLELWHTAQHHYLEVARTPDSQYFPYALPKLVKIARFTGDDTELKRIVTKIPPEAYPRNAKSDMYYLLGVRSFDEDDLAKAAKYFSQVGQSSPYFLKANYFMGVIYTQQSKYKSAVRSFRDVYRQEVEVYNDPRYLKEVEDLKQLSLLNIARIYYGIERFDEAGKYYDLVDRDSEQWPDAMFEYAWTNFMQNNLNDTLGQLLTVRSGFYNQDEWLPEAQVLRALTYFNLCEYDKVDKILKKFEQDHQPMHAELRDFTQQYASTEGKKLADQAWDAYFGPGKNPASTLPKPVFNRMLQNSELSGIVRHLDLMDAEEAIIDKQKSRWAESLGPYLKKVLEEDRQRYKRRAGLLMLKEMVRQTNKLADLLTQSEVIRFEVVDAQRIGYQYKAKEGDIGDALGKVDIDFATAVDYIYWPFNGEFWKDELGYYHYTEQGSCK